MYEKIQHNLEHLRIGQNLETGITGIHLKHWNSSEQTKI